MDEPGGGVGSRQPDELYPEIWGMLDPLAPVRRPVSLLSPLTQAANFLEHLKLGEVGRSC